MTSMVSEDLEFSFKLTTRTDHCEAHGEFENKRWRSEWTGCPDCNKERKAAELAEKEARDRHYTLQRHVQNSGIPLRFHDRTLESFIADTEAKRKALDVATEYVDDFESVYQTGRSALFFGKVGTGKTHLACAIGMQIMKCYEHPILFTTTLDAIRRVKASWNRGSDETEQQAIDALVRPSLLILDEVGMQYGTDTEKMILFDILNGRYEQRLPTLLLSNFEPHKVKAFIGERVYDRLREGGGSFVAFTWESWRGKAKDSGLRD